MYEVFQLLQVEGSLHLNVKKNEIWWPSRSSSDPFPAEVDRVTNEGVKLLGVPIGTKEFTSQFVKKKLKVLKDVCDLLKEVDNAQVELGLFRRCLSFNKINHLLRTSPPDLLEEALSQFDEHFHAMLATILRASSQSKAATRSRVSTQDPIIGTQGPRLSWFGSLRCPHT